jgi:pyruvate ferredoxin oxidoreductase gamma subunit
LGLKAGGIAIINTEKALTYPFPEGVKVITIDATSIALRQLGVPITNTTLMGAFAAASGEIKLTALEDAVRRRFKGDLAEKNIAAAEEAYQFVKGVA